MDRHPPHDAARNARFFIGIVNPAKMVILSAGQHAAIGTGRLQHGDAGRLALGSPAQCQAALRADVVPDSGTAADRQLLRAVLDGWCSDVATEGSCEAGLLLRALRPQWYHQLPPDHRDGPPFTTGHLWLGRYRNRSVDWSRLVKINSRYEALRKAADSRGRGQKGTTEPMGFQNSATSHDLGL